MKLTRVCSLLSIIKLSSPCEVMRMIITLECLKNLKINASIVMNKDSTCIPLVRAFQKHIGADVVAKPSSLSVVVSTFHISRDRVPLLLAYALQKS